MPLLPLVHMPPLVHTANEILRQAARQDPQLASLLVEVPLVATPRAQLRFEVASRFALNAAMLISALCSGPDRAEALQCLVLAKAAAQRAC